jgi:predicted nucleotidyltransferase
MNIIDRYIMGDCKMDKKIMEITDNIAKECMPKKIFLFGSYANNTNKSDSDLDFCIVLDMKDKRKIDILRSIRRKLYSISDIPLDLLIYDDKEFTERSDLTVTLENKIKNEGVLVYDQSRDCKKSKEFCHE